MVVTESSGAAAGAQQGRRFSSSATQYEASGTCDAQVTESEVNASPSEPPLSYHQKRRQQQALRAAEGKHKRGPTRGLKSRCWREKNPGEKPYAKISDSMRRVVGAKAAELISECSLWVKEYCPLNSRSWVQMEKRPKERLLDKIQGEWNLPRLVGGISVRKALSSQCAALYRGWQYRLKEENFVGYSEMEAKARKPPGVDKKVWDWLVDEYWGDPKQKARSQKNKRNRLKQTIKHSNGAKSTARILEDLINAPSTHVNCDGDTATAATYGNGQPHIEHDEDPIYVKLYDKTHRHKDGTLDADAEANLKSLKDLHTKQIEEHGTDNLTPFEAFPMVLSERSGYIRGLGYGPKPPKRARVDAESSEMRAEIEQLQQAATQRETEISNLKSESVFLKQQMEEMKLEILEREKKIEEERVEREKNLRQELMAMIQSSKGVM